MQVGLSEKLDRIIKTPFGSHVYKNNTVAAVHALNAAGKGGFNMKTMRVFLGLGLAFCVLHGNASLAQEGFPAAVPTVGTLLDEGGQEPNTQVGALPSSNDAPPVAVVDPLENFRKAQQAAAPAPVAEAKTPTPAPTPGGFQNGGTAVPADQAYDFETIEDVEAKQAELQEKARSQAFDAAVNGMMPMTPDQVRTLLEKYREMRDVSERRIGGVPTPEITSQTLSLEPGVLPPVVKLSPGHVTSVTILDMSGEPWPVQDVSWGGDFEVVSPDEGGHVIRVTPLAATAVGNMAVNLIGLKTPVTFTLETQLEVVQYRFDARIPQNGPNAKPPLIERGLEIQAGSDKALVQILDGVPPAGTKKVKLSGVDGRTSIYRVGDVSYLRTPLTLLSPGWSASVKSADGMTVYTVNSSPVFLLSDGGRMVRAVVQEK